MRNRWWAVVALLGACAEPATAQGLAELKPLAADPFAGPIFRPTPGAEPTLGPSDALNDLVHPTDPKAFVRAPDGTDELCSDAEFAPWFRAELLIGRTRGVSVAPVVTTGPAAAGLQAGAIGQADTVPLFGGRRVLDDWRTGLRVETGAWFDRSQTLGAELRAFSLFTGNEQFRAVPDGTVLVNVPQSVALNGQTVQVPAFVGFPGVTAGQVNAGVQTSFVGGDLSLRGGLVRSGRTRVDVLAGYRHMYLSDALDARFRLGPVGANPAAVPQLFGFDEVRTRNNFFGPQLGLSAATGGKRVWVEGYGATALGVTVSDFSFARSRTVGLGTGGPQALLNALGLPPTLTNLAIAQAVGQIPLQTTSTADRLTYFGVVLEGGLRANVRLTEAARLTAGYSVLYWNNVRRGQEMFAVGQARRTPAMDFTTHLFSVGLDLRY